MSKSLIPELKNKKLTEDDDQNFIKKDEKKTEEKKSEVPEDKEVRGVIWKLKNLVFPKNNQQRNLAREVGGLEVEKAKESSEKDVWDDRSEEVDRMAKNVFNSSGMRSMLWKKKRARLEAAKHALVEVGAKLKGKVTSQDENAAPTQGYVARLKNLRQDRSGIDHNNDGGGMSR